MLAELSPVSLKDIPESDLGDFNHPSAVRCNSNLGFLTPSLVKSLINPSPPTGPLYSPDEALQLSLDVSAHGVSNWLGAKIPIRSHLNIDAMSLLLDKFPDPWVLRGSKFGWPLSRPQDLPLSGVTWPNHASCNKHIVQVLEFIETEVSLGALYPLGLAPKYLMPPISTIPLLCVPKPPSLT